MKFKYAFNLGRVFTLSLAELFAVFENMGLNFRLVDLYREVFIIETETELHIAELQKRLGGTIKIMQIMDSLGRKKLFGPTRVFKDYFDAKLLKEKFLATTSGKVQVGVSLYPMARQLPLRGEAKRLGLEIKDILTASGLSTRIMLPQNEAISLPSVVVTHEHLLEKGAELDFLVGNERIYLAKTLSVQDFEDYGRRDYQRPVRDTQVGLLPPKVAQVMINLAQAPAAAVNLKSAILDPFAGSGTILQEAMLMGLKVIGTDASEKAVENAEKNLLWIKNRYKLPPGRFELAHSDVKDLAKTLPTGLTIQAIITEGTLGPAYAKPPTDKEVTQNFSKLEKTYLAAFKVFKQILSTKKRVVVALPAYRVGTGYRFFEVIDKIVKLGYDIVNPLPEIVLESYDFLQVTNRNSIIYDRKDQFVSREIFIFKVT